MQSATCSACNNTFKKSETFEVLGRTLCGPCGEQFIAELGSKTLNEGDIVRNLDPTVCAWCSTDKGDTPLPTLIAKLPTCEACNTRMRNWPYPMWVKASFAAILVVAVVAFIWNWRFLDALISVRRGGKAMQVGNLAKAADLFDHAATCVPEEKTLGDLAAFPRGLVFLTEDHSKEAVPFLERAAGAMPENDHIKRALITAKIGVAFDDKDYDTMVSEARAIKRLDPNDWSSSMALASAQACRYAAKGDKVDYDSALDELEAAKKTAGDNADAALYEDRIRHRLETREIIRREEFAKRFPHGWHGGKEAKQGP